MKREIVMLLACVSLFCACNHEVVLTNTPAQSPHIVRFRLNPVFEVEPFDDTKSIPGKIPHEPVMPKSGGETEKNHSFTHIEYAVYDAGQDTLVHHRQFSGQDDSHDDFGIYVYDTLKAGTYKVCLLTHSTAQVTFDDDVLQFDAMSDTFYGGAEFDINIATAGNIKEVVLRRVVSCVEFVATDTVPELVKSFEAVFSDRYTSFDLFTGEAVAVPQSYTYAHTFVAEERGKDIFNRHAIFTFVPSTDPEIAEIQLNAKDYQGGSVKRRKLTDIPIVKNKVTRYTGILYTPGIIDDRFDLTFDNDGKWDDPVEENLTEE